MGCNANASFVERINCELVSFPNLTKNSSLALGIGYAELLTAANTVSSQSFRSLEAFTVVTVAYLMVSLVISAGLNLIRRRLATS